MHQSANLLHATPSDGSPKMRCIYALAHDAPRGRHCPLHQHDHWEFVFYRWGNIECPLGDKLYRTRPGLLLVTPPATPHAEIANTPYGNYHVGIEFSSPTRWIPSVTDDECGSLGHLFQGLVREKRGGSPESARLTELLLEQLDLLVRRAARASCEPPAEAVVRCVERLLEERYATPLSVQGMAREAGVSSSTLRRNFATRPRPHGGTAESPASERGGASRKRPRNRGGRGAELRIRLRLAPHPPLQSPHRHRARHLATQPEIAATGRSSRRRLRPVCPRTGPEIGGYPYCSSAVRSSRRTC